MTLDESVHGMRLPVIERAQVVGNISAVCWKLGISRTLFYRCAHGGNGTAATGCIAPAALAAGPAGRDAARERATRPGDRDQYSDLGLPPDRRLFGPHLESAPGTQHRAALPAHVAAARPRPPSCATTDLPMPVALSRTGRIRSKDKTEMISQIG